MTWDRLDSWWIEELDTDPTYESEIYPQLLRLLDPQPSGLYLDLGCGTGSSMAHVKAMGASVVGCDLNRRLLLRAKERGPVVEAKLPEINWARGESFDGLYLGLVLEHIDDEETLFRNAARVSKPGGVLAMVINHPIWTAPKSSPIEDAGGEVLYRPGEYFGRGYSDEPAGKQTVRFYHRTTADLLNAASKVGWDLQRIEESGLGKVQLSRYPEYAGQEQIPRLMGASWRLRRRADVV